MSTTWPKPVSTWPCRSYYLGDNVPGKPRKFLLFQGVPEYVEKCSALADEGYKAFTIA